MNIQVSAISFCYASQPLWAAVERIKHAGYDSVEFWFDHKGGDVNYKLHNNDQAARVSSDLANMGMKASSYCIGTVSKEDIPSLDKAFSYAKALGISIVNGDFESWDVLSEIDSIASRHGVLFALENHRGAPALESPDDLNKALMLTSPSIGVNLDIGQLVAAGFDTVASLQAVSDRLYHLQFQDVPGEGQRESAFPGKGKARLKDVLEQLKRSKFEGVISVEHDEDKQIDDALLVYRKYIADAGIG